MGGPRSAHRRTPKRGTSADATLTSDHILPTIHFPSFFPFSALFLFHLRFNTTMDALASQLVQLQEQIPGLVSTVARLSTRTQAQDDKLANFATTVGDLKTENARLATDNARLSSEVTELKSLVSGQETIIGELETMSYPRGRFVFSPAQDGRGRGVWWWSQVRPSSCPSQVRFSLSSVNFPLFLSIRPSIQTRFQSSVPPPAQAKPLATMQSLPPELVREIASYVEAHRLATLCRVSRAWLSLFAPLLYVDPLKLGPKAAVRYAVGRGVSSEVRFEDVKLIDPEDLTATSRPVRFHSQGSSERSMWISERLRTSHLQLFLPDASPIAPSTGALSRFQLKDMGSPPWCLHLPTPRLTILIQRDTRREIWQWRSLVNALSPAELWIVTPDNRPADSRVPTAVEDDYLLSIKMYPETMKHLESVWFEGPGSIPFRRGKASSKGSTFLPPRSKRPHYPFYRPGPYPAESQESATVVVMVRRDDGSEKEYPPESEGVVAELLSDTSYLKDTRIVSLGLKR